MYEGTNIITLAEENKEFTYRNMLCVESAGDHPEAGHQDTQIQFNKGKFTRANVRSEVFSVLNDSLDLFSSKSVTNEYRRIFNEFRSEYKKEKAISRNNLGRNVMNAKNIMDSLTRKVRQKLLKAYQKDELFNYAKYEGVVKSRKQFR